MADVTLKTPNRADLVRRGLYLEYFTIGYNSLEGLVALVAGLMAGSIALVGFGFDSLIEVTSGSALLWRLHLDADEARRERVEAVTLRIVGVLFLLLAAYVSYDSTKSLIWREEPRASILGIVLAIASLIVMPLLVRAKRKVARASRAAP
jgi:divalent metal cation (Fe/Co/Zn/Cd) transporter